MKRTWTAEKAFKYIKTAEKNNKIGGLTYCSAYDFLRKHVSTEEKNALEEQFAKKKPTSPKKRHKPTSGNQQRQKEKNKLASLEAR